MLVVIPIHAKNSIYSTKSIKSIFHSDILFENIYINADINCDILFVTTLTYTTKLYTSLLIRSLKESYNCTSETDHGKHIEFMGDERVMAGANCKRYLQNKLGERKRRRPNSSLLESAEFSDERLVGDTSNSTRLRQTIRQSSQKHLVCTANNLAVKLNKTEDLQTRTTTAGSKKYLRSNKQEDREHLTDYEEMKKHSPSSEYNDTMNYTGSDKDENSNNGRDAMYDAAANDITNENYKNVGKHDFEEDDMFDNEKNINDADNENFEEICTKQDMQKENDTTFNSSTSIGSGVKPPSLMDMNESTHAATSTSYECLENVVFEKPDELYVNKEVKEEKDNFDIHKTVNPNNESQSDYDVHNTDMRLKSSGNEGGKNEHTVQLTPSSSSHDIQTTHSLCHTNENIASSPHFNNNNDEDEHHQSEYENDLSHLSNSVCSENSSSSNPSCEISMENINENFSSNESNKQPYEGEINPNEIEQNQKHVLKLTNIAMNSSLVSNSTKNPHTLNIGISSSPKDEQYSHYNADEINGCAIKSSPPTVPPINITTQTNQETSNENKCFQETDIKNGCPDVSVASAADATGYNKEEEAGPFNNPKTSTNINIGNIDQRSDCKENNLKNEPTTTSISQSGNRHSPLEEHLKNDSKLQDKLENKQEQENQQEQEDQHFNKYLEQSSQVQHTHQQHEKDIIDAADKVYTQIEEQYHHQQHHVASISSTYGQMLNSHQQNEHEEHQHRHSSAVHNHQHLQNQTIQHSMQQHYSAEQLYQLQQQEHHQQLHMQHQMQKQELQQLHNMPGTPQREHRQQHSHIMDFLHPQHHHHNVTNTHSPLHQQQQIHEVYHDLMMDEFHEEHNSPYKL
ncbi:hypothetical protein CVS40_11973 [Lucilia cuprina]|nr:hypothetical protein CVS40_11973 [Lucilia cuprina]